MEKQKLDWLFETETQQFLEKNMDQAPESFLLSKALANKGWDTKVLARQLKGLKIAKAKFPTWYSTSGILFPVAVSLEQASSELTAKYKAGLLKGDSAVDLSGGMGVDSFFLSQRVKHFIYVEPNQELHDLTQHNFKKLEAQNIQCYNCSAVDFLKQNKEQFSWVYIDPSRRKGNERLAAFSEWEPDLIGLKPLIWEFADHMLIKLSPMVDLTEVCKEIGEVKEVHVVSDRNECKEVLLVVEKGWLEPYRIVAVVLKEEQCFEYAFTVLEEQEAKPLYSDALEYLYEPDTALLKAGAFKKVAIDFNIKKIHPHTHLYTSDILVAPFVGRSFQVQDVKECTKKNMNNLIAKGSDFHVMTRNAMLTADQVKAQWKLIERGDLYLILFKGLDGKQYIAKAKKV